MAKPTYYEMLRDPRWQKMRLEVMERDKFTCRRCGDTTSTLNVHHTYYEKGFAPWDYPAHSLRTLCESCHEKAQERMAELQRVIGLLAEFQLDIAIGYCRGLAMRHRPTDQFPLESDEVIEGMTDHWFFNDGTISLLDYTSEEDAAGNPLITLGDISTAQRELAEVNEEWENRKEKAIVDRVRREQPMARPLMEVGA